MMKKLFNEWYDLHKEEIKADYIAVNTQRYGYGSHYHKWEDSFKEFALNRITKEEWLELTREGGKEYGWNICSAMIEQGHLDGYYS